MLFACIFVPDFAAEAIVRAEPDLRGTAVAVVEGKPPLLTVVAANEAARHAGVECGMTNVQAGARLNHCSPGAVPSVIRRRSALQEVAAHAALVDCARAISPRVEECVGAPDTVLLDLDGLERLFGSPRNVAGELARRGSELGLETNVAVSTNLDSAICVAHGFSGMTVIPDGKEAERLAPLPIEILLQVAIAHETVAPEMASRRKRPAKESAKRHLTPDRAAEVLETLDRWGVRTFRALAALPEVAVAERLGPEGVYLQLLCRGEGQRVLVPTDTHSTFEETIELEHPIDDLERLAFILSRLLEQLCARLSARALSTNELRLRFDLEACPDYDVAEPKIESNGESKSCTEHERRLRLPVPMLDAKVFLRLWQLELRSKPPAAAITRVRLRAEPVQPRNTQGGLFLPAAPEPERLELTLARIAAVVGGVKEDEATAASQGHRPSARKPGAPFNPGGRFVRSTHTVTKPPLKEMISLDESISSKAAVNTCGSDDSLRVGTPEILDSHRSDAFRMKHFCPPASAGTDARACNKEPFGEANAGQSSHGIAALRLFRPPLAVSVEVIDGRPSWIDTTDTHNGTHVISGEVAWCSGPWRTSGEWWNESWSREEWDLAVHDENGRIVCRIYRDQPCGTWFVEGIYD